MYANPIPGHPGLMGRMPSPGKGSAGNYPPRTANPQMFGGAQDYYYMQQATAPMIQMMPQHYQPPSLQSMSHLYQHGHGPMEEMGKRKKGAGGRGSNRSDSGDERRKLRRMKDPNKPVKARTAYLYFMQAVRDQVAAENPGASFGDVGKIVGQKWRDLPETEKQVYEQLAAADKQRYTQQMMTYVKPPNIERRKRRKKDPNAPKKARSPYTFFMTSMHKIVKDENPTAPFSEIGRIVGERWKNLTPEERRPYEELADADKARNALETQNYKV